jgi:phosphosulfolactate phosphohydrolase-like enzyme
MNNLFNKWYQTWNPTEVGAAHDWDNVVRSVSGDEQMVLLCAAAIHDLTGGLSVKAMVTAGMIEQYTDTLVRRLLINGSADARLAAEIIQFELVATSAEQRINDINSQLVARIEMILSNGTAVTEECDTSEILLAALQNIVK